MAYDEDRTHWRHHGDTGSKSIGQRVDELEKRAHEMENVITNMRIEMKGIMVKMWVGSTLLSALAVALLEWVFRK